MPFLHWYHNGAPLQTGPICNVSQFGPYLENIGAIQPEPVKMSGELEMLNPSIADTGLITCVAENSHGRAETTLSLDVAAKRRFLFPD